MLFSWTPKKQMAADKTSKPEPMMQKYAKLEARPKNSKSSLLASSIITIAVSCVLSTIIGFMIANTSQRMDLNSILKDFRSKYDQMFGTPKENHFKNALIVSLLGQSHHDFAQKKNFNLIPASTELEKREATEVGTTGNLPNALF